MQNLGIALRSALLKPSHSCCLSSSAPTSSSRWRKPVSSTNYEWWITTAKLSTASITFNYGHGISQHIKAEICRNLDLLLYCHSRQLRQGFMPHSGEMESHKSGKSVQQGIKPNILPMVVWSTCWAMAWRRTLDSTMARRWTRGNGINRAIDNLMIVDMM